MLCRSSSVGTALFHNILNETVCSGRIDVVQKAKLFWGEVTV